MKVDDNRECFHIYSKPTECETINLISVQEKQISGKLYITRFKRSLLPLKYEHIIQQCISSSIEFTINGIDYK